jgi:hypothetical protein
MSDGSDPAAARSAEERRVPPASHPSPGSHHRPRHGPFHRGRSRIIVAAVALAVIVLVAVLVLAWVDRPAGNGSTGSPYPNPNPGKIPVVGIHAALNYSGATSDYFEIVEGANLCPQCPIVPSEDFQFTPPVAGFWVFFNVTNLGTAYHTVDQFKLLSPTYNGSPVFTIHAVFCCGPGYEEPASFVGLTPGQTMGLGVLVQAVTVPANGSSGYSLDLYLLTSD